MKAHAAFCDLCFGEGRIRLAVAKYWNEDNDEWHTCAAHLKDVQRVGLDYEKFDTLGDTEEG